jgi:hypothetical protein
MRKIILIFITVALLVCCKDDEFSRIYQWESSKKTVNSNIHYSNDYIAITITINIFPAVPACESPYKIEWQLLRYRHETDSLLGYGTLYSDYYYSSGKYNWSNNCVNKHFSGVVGKVNDGDELYMKFVATFKNKINLPANLQTITRIEFN